MIAIDMIPTVATAAAFRVALFVSSRMSSLLVVWLQQSHSRALPLLDRLNTASSRVWGKRSTETRMEHMWMRRRREEDMALGHKWREEDLSLLHKGREED